MRTFKLRVYTLCTTRCVPKEALDFYREKIYPRHLNSFPLLRGGRRSRRGRSAAYAKH
jgi:hypothetical protein